MTLPTALADALPAWDRIDQPLAWHAARTPQAPCFTAGTLSMSHAEADARVGRLVAALARAGVAAGDRVALLATPRPEYLLLLMALSRCSAVYVGLNPRSTGAELAHVLGVARPRLVLSLRAFEGRDYAASFAEAAALAPGMRLPPVVHFDDLPGFCRAVDELPALPPAGTPFDGEQSAALARSAAIVFTSGTTGRPKAAMLTHEGLLHAAAVQHARLNPPMARYLCNLPINHVGCLMNLTLGALVGGGSIVFQERFAPAETLRLLRDERVSVWLQVPAMFHECARRPEFEPAALGALHSICIGGGAPSPATLAQLRRIGARLFVEYGQTETSSSGTYSDDGADDEVLTQCIGRFDPRFEFRIADAEGRLCPPGAVGEIQARGRLVFAGYLGDLQAAREAFTGDGWLHTGDLAEQRADGNIMLRGRLSEMIKTGGYNVYPREIELTLEAHPAVGQVVVLPLPDERYGEAVHAVLRTRDAAAPAPQAAELAAWCRRTLANYKVPKSFRLVEAFPLLPNGKIDRIRTRALAPGLSPLR